MKSHNVKFELFMTILILVVIPMSVSYWFIGKSLDATLNLGFNQDIQRILTLSQQNLKTLKKLDSRNTESYRVQFEANENLKHIYENRDLLVGNITGTMKVYFLAGILFALILSLSAAIWLSKRIASAYQNTLTGLIQEKERGNYLQEISAWQGVAQVLAHEIKNPLTPIELMVSHLEKSFLVKSSEDFQVTLKQSREAIGEELYKLKQLVFQFSGFAKSPSPVFQSIDLKSFCHSYVESQKTIWEACDFKVSESGPLISSTVNLDPVLFKQALNNIVSNAIEANSGEKINLAFELSERDSMMVLQVSNSGHKISSEIASKIFLPHFSTKSHSENMGLGLSVVKKIILEHSGQIQYEEKEGRACFTIVLPKWSHA